MKPLNGFTGSVSIKMAKLPSGVTASPATLTLTSTSPQAITVTAGASASIGTSNATVTATGGTESHQYSLTLTVISGDVSAPLRTTYLDVGYATFNFVNGVNYPGWHISIYDPPHKLFFVSATFGGEVVAISTQSEEIVARIPVPQPYGMGFSVDGDRLYVATATNFMYVIDPVRLQVSNRIDMSNWGGRGYSMVQPLGLAGEKIGFLEGLTASGGSVYIWSQADNSVEHVVDYAWGIIRSRDGTKIAYCSANTPEEVGIFDIATRQLLRARPISPGFTLAAAFHPTNNQFLAVGGANGYTHAVLYDENLNILHDYTNSDGTLPNLFFNPTNGFFSRDGSEVFLEQSGAHSMAVLDANTFQLKGYTQSIDPSATYLGKFTQDVDETGLAVAASHQGVVLVDTNNIFSTLSPFGPLFSPSGPLSGPEAGGTAVRLQAYTTSNVIESIPGAQAFFGTVAAPMVAASYNNGALLVDSTAPAGSPGAVNVGLYLPDGSMTMAASVFSYGPDIRDQNVTASTAEGGPAVLYGYGLNKGATILLGNGSTSGTASNPGDVYSPGQLSKLTYVIPSGAPGKSDFTIQTADGVRTYRNYFRYYPAPEEYPLSGSTLWMGLYDPTRRLIYFTANDRINVFSAGAKIWLAPILLPASPNPRQLRYEALSPQAGYLAVTDPGNRSLVVIDLSARSFLREVSLQAPFYFNPAYLLYPAAFASETQVVTLAEDELHLTDVTTGSTVWTKGVPPSNYGIGAHTRMILDATGRFLLFDNGSYLDMQESTPVIPYHSWGCFANNGSEFAISATGWISQGGCIMNSDMKVTSQIYISDAQYWSSTRRFGQVWDPSGTYILQPTSVGLDLIDPKRGSIRERITSSLAIPDSDFVQVLDPDDQLLYLITDQGIAALDIQSLPTGIASVTPNSGLAGTLVQIRGTGFDATTQVIVDGQSVNGTFIDSNTLQFTAPQHADGPVQIVVKAADESQDSLDAAFVYSATPLIAPPDTKAAGEGRIRMNRVPTVYRVKQPLGEGPLRFPANGATTPR